MQKRFVMIGASGFIAPKHIRAINDTGNELVACMDTYDGIGLIDSYFPNAEFFTEFELFSEYIYQSQSNGEKIDYLSICSPNYLHRAHASFGLREGLDVICEKPLVLYPNDIDILTQTEKRSGRKINAILQLRLGDEVKKLKKMAEATNDIFDIELTYITTRGKWYEKSWKGDVNKSGGVTTNIGVHLFDILTWIFGDVKHNELHLSRQDKASGYLELDKARVKWFLSTDYNSLPEKVKTANDDTFKSYRSITYNDKSLDLSKGFTNLHEMSYEKILAGEGFGIKDVYPAINLAYEIRNMKTIKPNGNHHPYILDYLK